MNAPDKIKRRRLASLLCIRGVTEKALHNILLEVRGGGVPEASLWDVRAAARSEYDDEVPLQLKLPLVNGGAFLWSICRPCA